MSTAQLQLKKSRQSSRYEAERVKLYKQNRNKFLIIENRKKIRISDFFLPPYIIVLTYIFYRPKMVHGYS
jgi:hypothetical protein